ncbi:hypothetical protein BG006_008998 [Podila minutissima]|uniref:Uncharacterized protein n=1 Tax=Podila minutissima TaxID=64525 RepID=A0A9P5VJR6_9FUNG|nr:hypothetical protein BG006_008998 [Podila minutissima]
MITKRKADTDLTKEKIAKKAAGSSNKDEATLVKVQFFFQDPPKVNHLIKSVRLEEFDALLNRDQRLETGDDGDNEEKTRYAGFQIRQHGSEESRHRALKAALYFRSRFQMMAAQGSKGQLHKVGFNKANRHFKDLVRDISRVEPDLKGVTACALVSLYLKIVSAKRYLDARLAFEKQACIKVFTATTV